MKNAKLIIFISIFLICAFLGVQIISTSKKNQDRKHDYSEINNIKYGLFSVSEWKNQLAVIINDEVSDFDITQNEKELKPLIEAQLSKMIDRVNERIKDKNKKSFKGKIKQAFINAFVDVDDIKAGVPGYANEVMKLMSKPKAKRNLKNLLLNKVGDYFEKTFEEEDLTAVDEIVKKMQAVDAEDAKIKLNKEIADAHISISLMSWSLLALVGLVFLIAGFSKNPMPSSHYIVLVLDLFILLICGVTIPMIDLEAKISEMSFILMDHPVKFLNQILYFQTKSVVDVFWLMISDPQVQMKVVGVLIITFSIIFPVTKLLSSLFYYYNHWNARENKLIQFFVHKSGKWSMTDVMIIAIFMAYIGFNGVISNQFGKLSSTKDDIVLLTTNGTSLQPGFYLFMGYALFAMFLSEFLSRKLQAQAEK